jgi:competence protein ComEC
MSVPQNLEMIPMLKLVPALFLGILLGRYLDIHWHIWASSSAFFALMAFGIMFGRLAAIRYIYASGASFLLSLIFCGAALYQQGKPSVEIQDEAIEYVATVEKIIREEPEKTRAILLLTDRIGQELEQPIRVLSTIRAEGTELLPGDRLYFKTQIQKIPPPANPGQFNMQSYYGHKWIKHQTWIAPEQFVLEQAEGFPSLRRISYRISKSARQRIQQYLSPEGAATLQAMLLGVKHEVSREMLSTYQNAGVMHILAVSGMHVMIIYGGLIWIIKPLRKRKEYFSWIPLILVWIFAFVTGAGAAALRAALMLTFVDFGARTKNQSNNINLLLTSALFLLILQPYLLWDIGFQLSYAAMIGIFLFFKPLNDIAHISNKWGKNLLWSPSALSVSAQLGTTPLTLYYFGNFPVYFIISNILVLVPVTILLFAGMTWLVLSMIIPPSFNTAIAWLLDLLIEYGFNRPLIWLESLPAAYIQKIHIEPFQVILLMISIACFAAWIKNLRSGRFLILSLTLLLPVLAWSQYRYWQGSSTQGIIIPDVRDHQALAVGTSGSAYLWTDSLLRAAPEQADFSLSGMLKVLPWKKWTFLSSSDIMTNDSLLVVENKSFFRLHRPLYSYQTEKPIEVDVLFLSDDLYLDTAKFRKVFHPKVVVLDGSLSYRKRKLFRRLLEESDWPLHDTREAGALVLLQDPMGHVSLNDYDIAENQVAVSK